MRKESFLTFYFSNHLYLCPAIIRLSSVCTLARTDYYLPSNIAVTYDIQISSLGFTYRIDFFLALFSDPARPFLTEINRKIGQYACVIREREQAGEYSFHYSLCININVYILHIHINIDRYIYAYINAQVQ